jgi:predicted nucleic acid-binding protein
MTCSATEAEIAKYKQLFTLLYDTPAIYSEWERLVAAHQVLGKTAHDTHLVAAMRVHGIQQILTFNVRDFQRYPNIVVLSPHAVSQPISPTALPPQSNP